MTTLNIRLPSQTVDEALKGLALAIDFLRQERDSSLALTDAAGARRATRMRDALGALYQAAASERQRQHCESRSGLRWTVEEDEVLRACWGSARRIACNTDDALQSLADTLGRKPVAVAMRLHALGVWS